MMRILFSLASLLFFLFLSGCASHKGYSLNPFSSSDKTHKASAILESNSESQVKGKVTFTQHNRRVILIAEISGLKPNSEHGFHIHEKGNCASPGPHFNPYGSRHGYMSATDHHLGDITNLNADPEGNAYYQIAIEDINLTEGKTSNLNKTIVITDNPDDYQTQPLGNSGDAIACGVIKGN